MTILSHFNLLYQIFADKLGEDVAINILELCGFQEIDLENKEIDNYLYYFRNRVRWNVKRLINKYNLEFSIENEKKLRNYCFRHNIKIYQISEVIYDAYDKKTKVPLGKSFEQRPIIIKPYKKIQLYTIQEINGEYYMIIGYTDNLFFGDTITFDKRRIY